MNAVHHDEDNDDRMDGLGKLEGAPGEVHHQAKSLFARYELTL